MKIINNMENNKINIAEILKNCPTAMKLNCTIYENVEFDFVDKTPEVIYPIHCLIKTNAGYESLLLTCNGCMDKHPNAKCVIFPEDKTTWEGFVPPCKFKDGDIVATDTGDWIGITTGGETHTYIPTYCIVQNDNTFKVYFNKKEKWAFSRLATEEEKNKLFSVIKTHGYQWNEDTKSLEKLNKPKFDINTLVPFESRVLVRDDKSDFWKPAIYGYLNHSDEFYSYCVVGGEYYMQLIPFAGNEHLLGTIDDCDDFYKTWK